MAGRAVLLAGPPGTGKVNHDFIALLDTNQALGVGCKSDYPQQITGAAIFISR